MSEKCDILSLDKDELKQFIASIGEAPYRAKQIFSWLHKGCSFDEMTNISKKTRELLCEKAEINSPVIAKKLVSQIDGTIKYLLKLNDGQCIEAVFMRYEHGNTVCISSQAGCRMGCRFCASTIKGLNRSLLPSEILGQVLVIARDTGERVSNIVMMGIGEPLDNFDNVKKFLIIVNDDDGINIGYRHISLSTCGIVPKIYELAECDFPITLSVSLHASNNEKRSEIMPINKKYPIDDLLFACKKYFEKTKRRISFEYTLISGENDSQKSALELASLLKKALGEKMPVHVNLIPVNEVSERNFHKSSREAIDKFAKTLEARGITATVRRKLGSDINASCGQLRLDFSSNE